MEVGQRDYPSCPFPAGIRREYELGISRGGGRGRFSHLVVSTGTPLQAVFKNEPDGAITTIDGVIGGDRPVHHADKDHNE